MKTLTVLVVAMALAGCGGGGWLPWSTSSGSSGPYTPPGATAYACEGGKRLLVRFESDTKSAWVIYPDRQLRLDQVASASGQEFGRAGTTLAVKEGDTTLTEAGAVLFAGCKPEQAK
ncbi:MAG TPA: MliC family protein [Burkholderiales bacterium]|jgi:membrane-bound inhibitor of C-type lysozyme|nr:MliC family protein [Burkholderiales bacterium]